MGIGSSKGAFYHDEFHEEAAPWMIHPKDEDSKDNNVIDPEVDPKGTVPLENPIIFVGMKEPFSKDQTPRLEPGGIGGVEIRSGTQMRKGANDNKNLQIETPKHVEDAIEKSWNRFGQQQKDLFAIHDYELSIASKREFTDIDKARILKMKKEFTDKYGVQYD